MRDERLKAKSFEFGVSPFPILHSFELLPLPPLLPLHPPASFLPTTNNQQPTTLLLLAFSL